VWPTDEPDGLERYGTSVGAIRGTVRDALKRYPGMSRDDITRLSSELWTPPVFERRQAAIVLLQTHLELLVVNDLTRFEGFLRTAGSSALVEQLLTDVLVPMGERMDAASRGKALVVFERWAGESDPALVRAGSRLRSTN
jgi:hypothetical protein